MYNKVLTKNKKEHRWLQILFVFILCLLDSLYLNNGQDYLDRINYYILAILLIISIIFNKPTIGKNKIIFVYMAAVVLLFAMLINQSFSFGYVVKIALLLCAYNFTKLISFESFYRSYIKVITFLAGYSLVFYFFSNTLWDKAVVLYQNFPTISRKNYVYFYNLGFTNTAQDLYSRLRNYGIFQEPGAYAMFLDIAIAFLLFYNTDFKRFKTLIIILILAVLSTLSTSGIISMLIIVMAYFINKEKGNESRQTKIFIFILMLISLISILFAGNILDRVFGKFASTNGIQDHSYSGRLNAIIINIKIFMMNPILGVGPTRDIELLKEFKESASADIWVSQTNTILGIFAVFGFFIGTGFLYLILKFSNLFSNSKLVNSMVFIAILILLFSQDYEYSLLLHMLCFWGINAAKKSKTIIQNTGGRLSEKKVNHSSTSI